MREIPTSPSTGNPMTERSEIVTLAFRGQPFEIASRSWVCVDSVTEYQDAEQLNDTMRELELAWRRSHKLTLLGE
jgi:hypothetical protein